MIAAITGGEQASKRPAEGKQTGNQEEKKKEETDYQVPSMNNALKAPCFGLLMTCTDQEGVGGVPPTQPATSHSLDNCITQRDVLL